MTADPAEPTVHSTAEPTPQFVPRGDNVDIACRYQPGSADRPTLIFLPGYMSDMQGGKAQAVARWAAENGNAMLRVDYSGCGESGGAFADGTLSQWRDDVMLALNHFVRGPVILIGSSMGGWLMLLVAQALGKQLHAMIGIAAAPDFTAWGISDAKKARMETDGVVYDDNPYGPEPTPTYHGFVADSAAHMMLGSEIAIDCPVHLLHGQCDDDVPWEISLQLAAALRSENVQIRLVKNGDHRLSLPQDVAMLIDTVKQLAG